MKVEVKVSPTTIIVAEGDTHMDVFKQLAALTEVFGEEKCLHCNSPYKYQVRKATRGKKEFEYYELVCQNRDCRARLSLGQSEGGVLYPKRYKQTRNEEDELVYVMENGKKVVKGKWGWARFNAETKEEE